MKKITSAELDAMKVAELRVLGAELKLEGADTLKKPELRQAIKDYLALQEEKKVSRRKASAAKSASKEESDDAEAVKKPRTTRKTEKSASKKAAEKTSETEEKVKEDVKKEKKPAAKKTARAAKAAKTSKTADTSEVEENQKQKKTEKTEENNVQIDIADIKIQAEAAAEAAAAEVQTAEPSAEAVEEKKEPAEERAEDVKADESAEPAEEKKTEAAAEGGTGAAPAEKKADDAPRHERHEHRSDHRSEKNEQKYSEEERPVVTGILDIAEAGFGFLRFDNFLTSDKDIYVSPTQIRRFNLKKGDKIKGITRRANEGERFGALLYVNTVNGDEPGVSMHRPNFEDLTPIFPYERLRLEHSRSDLTTRIIDLVAPIGKGQRGLIVAPPKTGKTVLLKKIATTIEKNYPDMKVIVLLVDERPEEVTDMKESINGDVLYSTFDEQAEHHVKVAEMVLAHAERLAEHKKDVIILLDSITRLARAYNMVVPSSGKTLSGGIDPGALHKPKKFFGAARKLREGGSITILATALIETGSRMDDVIFEEFKGTGNMELHLDRKLSEKRIFPAVSLNKSGTRREDLLLEQQEMEAIWKIRRAMANQNTQEVTESIIENLSRTRCNADFIELILKTKVLG